VSIEGDLTIPSYKNFQIKAPVSQNHFAILYGIVPLIAATLPARGFAF
jgi:hypothetical protein